MKNTVLSLFFVLFLLPCFAQEKIPLNLFWSGTRKDNFTSAAIWSASNPPSGYIFVRVEGHIFKNQEPGTIPLTLYWNKQKNDNATLAGEKPENYFSLGYISARVEGYIYAEQVAGTIPLFLYTNFTTRNDIETIACRVSQESANGQGYKFGRILGYIFP